MRRPLAKKLNWIPFLFGAAGVISAVGQWQVSTLEQQPAALNARTELLETEQKLADVKQAVKTAEMRASDVEKEVRARAAKLNEYVDAVIVRLLSLIGELPTSESDSKSLDKLRKLVAEFGFRFRVKTEFVAAGAKG